MREENAKIISADIRFEYNGSLLCPSVRIKSSSGGSCEYGGRVAACRGQTADSPFGIDMIRRIMEIADVEKWSELPGSPIRVRWNNRGYAGDDIGAIGSFMRDDWLDLRELAEIHQGTAPDSLDK